MKGEGGSPAQRDQEVRLRNSSHFVESQASPQRPSTSPLKRKEVRKSLHCFHDLRHLDPNLFQQHTEEGTNTSCRLGISRNFRQCSIRRDDVGPLFEERIDFVIFTSSFTFASDPCLPVPVLGHRDLKVVTRIARSSIDADLRLKLALEGERYK